MPKFHEIYATATQPFKIRSEGGSIATCNADKVTWDASDRHVSAVSAATWEWELVTEPTVESVLRERGYELCPAGRDFFIEPRTDQRPAIRIFASKIPTTPEQAKAICDLLDGYR